MFTTAARARSEDQAQSSATRHPPRAERASQQSNNPIWQQLATRAQAKPAISAPADAHELEANRAADEAMNSQDQAVSQSPAETGRTLPRSGVGGEPIPDATRALFESRFGQDFNEVRLHTGPAASEAAQSLGAQAFTIGSDIVFGEDRPALETTEGHRLLAHELAHVAQQRGASEEAEGASNHTSTGPMVKVSHGVAPGSVIHRRPSELIDNASFLGNGIGGGINKTMRDRLTQVENHLKTVYDALGPNHPDRVHFGGKQKTLREWSEVTVVNGWRKGSTSFHASGSAVDINPELQPYIATRSQVKGATVYGGEAAGASLQAERKAATEVYDRAMQFIFNKDTADVSERRTGETTKDVYKRFSDTSRALSYYFRYAMLETPTRVKRKPIQNIEKASEADLLTDIPTTERRAEADAISSIQTHMDENFTKTHPNWTLTPRETYFRMLRDFEHVRIPMQHNTAEARPPETRNPTRGFLHLKPEVVEALVDVGRLRWGIADLGSTTSGDVHHFDLGNHGGVTPDGTEGTKEMEVKKETEEKK